MTTIIFLAALIKTRLLKSSSMLLINCFSATSTLQCCHARFFFLFLTNKAKKADVDALPYSALESKQAEHALDVLHTAGLDTQVKEE